MSWEPLSSTVHSQHFKSRASHLRPYAELLSRLSQLHTADKFSGHWSHDFFCIGTVASYAESDGTGSGTIVIIEKLRGDRFRIRVRGDDSSPNPGWYREGSELKLGGSTQDVRGEETVTVVGKILEEFLHNRDAGAA